MSNKVSITVDDLTQEKLMLSQMIAIKEENEQINANIDNAKEECTEKITDTNTRVETLNARIDSDESTLNQKIAVVNTQTNIATTKASEASASEAKAKEYMEEAFSGTPEGYQELVDTRLFVDSEGYICLKE